MEEVPQLISGQRPLLSLPRPLTELSIVLQEDDSSVLVDGAAALVHRSLIAPAHNGVPTHLHWAEEDELEASVQESRSVGLKQVLDSNHLRFGLRVGDGSEIGWRAIQQGKEEKHEVNQSSSKKRVFRVVGNRPIL